MSNAVKKKTANRKKSTSVKKTASGSSGRKVSAARRKEAATERKELEARESFMKKEAAFILVSFVALFLFVANFGVLGTVGNFFGGLQKGLFGYAAYVFPVALVLVVIFILRERKNVIFWMKIVCDAILLLCICSFLHLLFGEAELGGFSDYYALGKEGILYKGAAGGAIGAWIANSLVNSIAKVGAWLLLIALFVLCLVVITEKSIISVARKGAETATHTAKAGSKYAKERLGEEKVRMEARREARILQKKEERMEQDLRRKEAEMLSPDSSVFDLRKGPDSSKPSDTDFLNQKDPLIRLNNSSEEKKEEPRSSILSGNDTVIIQGETRTEPDYSSDEIPFAETQSDRYKAYGKMLSGDKIDLAVAEKMGFAVSKESRIHPLGTVETRNSDPAVFREKNHAPNLDYPQEEGDFLHRPLDPDEIVYPETGVQDGNVESTSAACSTDSSVVHTAETAHVTLPGGYDELNHITDEERDHVYDERERAAKEGEVYEPFSTSSPLSEFTETAHVSSKPSPEEAQTALDRKRQEEKKKTEVKARPYQFPPVTLLKKGVRALNTDNRASMGNARKLEQVLSEFGVGVTVTNVVKGPRVTRYEMTPDVGVKVSRITSLAGDIKLALAASELRIEAPIPGKSAVGIEVPNEESATVTFRDIMETDEFRTSKSKLTWGVGLDIQGTPVVGDIAKMPHLLVSGTTGSGKSVGINSIIMSVIYRSKPEDVKMILVDPKVVELSVYDGIPHLLAPVVTKPDQALAVLNKACAEMQHRYNLFKESNTRNIIGYNEKVEEVIRNLPEGVEKPEKLPYILIIIDELSELMMHSKRDVEAAIVSLTQLARAAGIHLVVATQRPSVDVVTGLIKSNIPSRVAYRLPSGIDSRTILDSYGAETLLGNGDMLYKPGNMNSPLRVQGAYLSDGEVEEVVDWLKKHNSVLYDDEWENIRPEEPEEGNGTSEDSDDGYNDGRDEYFVEAGKLITEKKKASIGLLQRKFKIGFNRASRIMEQLNEAGVVSEGEGTKERMILMSTEEFREKFNG